MASSSLDANLPPQETLRLSRGNRIACVIIMVLGWISDADRTSSAVMLSGSGTIGTGILRVADQTMTLDKLGITIKPTDGWTCIQPIGFGKKDQMVFVNPKHHVIATIDAVRFRVWPPEQDVGPVRSSFTNSFTLDDMDRSITSVVQSPRIFRKLESSNYGRQSVQWFQKVDEGFRIRRYGRIDAGNQELLIEVMTHNSGMLTNAESAIGRLCETIAGLD
ncbi:MAG: hypothetical protein WBD20_03150 [Pirellulaceae bacterium]